MPARYGGSDRITYQGTEIDMGAPWARHTMKEAVKKYCGADYDEWGADDAAARECAKKLGVEPEEGERATKGHVLIALFEAFVEDKLIQPTIIYDYPVENSPLAKRKPSDPAFTERFEYFICSKEFGQRLLRAERPHRPEGEIRKAGKGKARAGAWLQRAGRRGLHNRARIRPSPPRAVSAWAWTGWSCSSPTAPP